MTTDRLTNQIVVQLRTLYKSLTRNHEHWLKHAADEIERLTAALEVAKWHLSKIGDLKGSLFEGISEIARDGLREMDKATGVTHEPEGNGPDLELIKEQAGQGIFVEHECPAFFACCAIVAEFHQDEPSEKSSGE